MCIHSFMVNTSKVVASKDIENMNLQHADNTENEWT